MGPRIYNSLRKIDRIRYAIKRYRGITIETDLTPYNSILRDIYAFDTVDLSDREIKKRMITLKNRMGVRGLEQILPEAFALIREAIKGALGIVPYDVQIIAGIALHQGKLAQMQTGEGKTLAAVFPAALNALTGRGVHILTANEYLAKRDALWMGPIYRALGISVSFIQERMDNREKRRA